MKPKTLAAITLCIFIASVAGCDQSVTHQDSGNKEQPAAHVHSDGTVHSDDHHHTEGHAHGPGPHGGTIVDWGGGKFHVELTVDHQKQQVTAYVFGTDEKTPVPIDAKQISLTIKAPTLTIALAAKPLGSELLGGSSRFVGTHEGLAVVRDYEGSLSGVVDDTPYSGNFKEAAHANE